MQFKSWPDSLDEPTETEWKFPHFSSQVLPENHQCLKFFMHGNMTRYEELRLETIITSSSQFPAQPEKKLLTNKSLL